MIVATERTYPDYPWEYFLEYNERRYLSARSSSQKPQRQSAIRLCRTREEGTKISGQLWVVASFFLFSSVSFSPPPPHYPLSRPRPSSSFYCFSRRRQTVANRIRGPLFTRSPATLCLLLTNFGRSFPLSPPSLFLFHQSHQVFLSTGSSQLSNLYFLVTASWLQRS